MTYKNRLIILSALIFILVLLYAGSFIFSYDAGNTRSSFHVWLDSQASGRLNRIVINSLWNEFELVKKNNQWFIVHDFNEYPARQMRIEDFLSIFTARSAWPLRSSSASSHVRFGLDERASQITFFSDNSILLDLLLGDDDIMGRESYFRIVGHNEVRSGDNNLRAYISGVISSWYNLRLIPESENGGVNSGSVQRLTVYNEGQMQVFTRAGRRWEVSGINVANPDMNNIENYINFILNAEGDNFADPVFAGSIIFDHSRIILEFGNGSIVNIRFSEPDENYRQYAQVSGSEYIYDIPLWVTMRLFRDASSFETQ